MQPAAAAPLRRQRRGAAGRLAASRYAGKAPRRALRAAPVGDRRADERATRVAVALRSGARRGTKARRDEKLHCFLTEAPARFCAPNLKRKATADVINYFKGIEYTNTAIVVAAKVR